MTPLHIACYFVRPVVVAKLLEAGADIHAKDYSGQIPLHTACSARCGEGSRIPEVVAMLLVAGPTDVNARMDAGLTPLDHACFRGHRGVVGVLLDAGAELNTTASGAKNSLHIACARGHTEIAERLLGTTGANINTKTAKGETPLHFACKYNHAETVKMLLAAGANRVAPNEEGQLPVDLATDTKIQVLLQPAVKGAD